MTNASYYHFSFLMALVNGRVQTTDPQLILTEMTKARINPPGSRWLLPGDIHRQRGKWFDRNISRNQAGARMDNIALRQASWMILKIWLDTGADNGCDKGRNDDIGGTFVDIRSARCPYRGSLQESTWKNKTFRTIKRWWWQNQTGHRLIKIQLLTQVLRATVVPAPRKSNGRVSKSLLIPELGWIHQGLGRHWS